MAHERRAWCERDEVEGGTRLRVLFSAVAAHGHVLPLASFKAAAIEQAHEVALLTSAGLAGVVASELPAGVEHLPAGAMPPELAAEAIGRTGGDFFDPSLELVGEVFGAPTSTSPPTRHS